MRSAVGDHGFEPRALCKPDAAENKVLEVVFTDERAARGLGGLNGIARESAIRDDRAGVTLSSAPADAPGANAPAPRPSVVGANVAPDVLVGRGVQVHAGAVVVGSVLMPGAIVGRDAIVARSVIPPGSRVPAGARVIDEVFASLGESERGRS